MHLPITPVILVCLLSVTAAVAAQPVAAADSLSPPARGADPVTEAELRAHVAVLASDAYGGRLPGTPGETLTAHYIASALGAAGFVGAGPGGSFYQPVPLVELYPREGEARYGVEVMTEIAVRAPSGTADVGDAPAIFVGHGVDPTGAVRADVRGKIALMLGADRPGEGDQLPLALRRDALVAAGARGVIIIGPAGVSLEQLARSFTSGRPQLAARVSRAEVEAVMTAAAADRLFAENEFDAGELRLAVAAADFPGVDLRQMMTLRATTFRRAYNSYNVAARLPGRRGDSGTVMMTGHWDHLGSACRPEGAPDRICNGAVDNASGIAVLIAAAQRLGAGAAVDRDVMIVATTAEEQGLLGAYHFVAQPLVPLASIIIVLNVDTVAIAPRGAPMAMVGRGTTGFDDEIDRVALSIGRTVDGDDEANAFIRRQDGWAFTQAGVPSIMAGGSFSDMGLLQAFLDGTYHGPDDELSDATPLGGAADDAELHIALVRHFANVAAHP